MAIRVPIGAEGIGAERRGSGSAGEPVRFDELWADVEFVRAFSARTLSDPIGADDVVQDTYVQALRHLDEIDRRESCRPWLATVARRRSWNELRRRRRVDPVESFSDTACGLAADPADVVAASETLDEALRAFDLLTPRERRLLERQLVEGLTVAELAELEDSTPASVKSVLRRARAKLRVAIDGTHVHVLAPVGAVVGSIRRHLTATSAKLQTSSPWVPGGYERIGEALTAAVMVLAVGASAGAPSLLDDRPAGDESPAVSRLAATASSDHPSVEGRVSAPTLPGQGRSEPPTSEVHESPVQSSGEPSAPLGDDGADSVTWGPDLPSPLPSDSPVPSPSDSPVDPDEPVAKDDSDEPEDASFTDFAWVGSPTAGSSPELGSEASGGQGASGSSEVFAVGALTGRCASDCSVLFHSADGGATWERLPAEGLGEAYSVFVAPAYPRDDRIYVMGPSGLRLSEDGGQSFRPVSQPHGGEAAMSPAFSEGDDRILIGAAPSWVYDAKHDVTRPIAAAPLTGTRNRFAFPPNHAETGLVFAATITQGSSGVKTPVVYHCHGEVCDYRVELRGLHSTPKMHLSSTFADDGVMFVWGMGGMFRSTDHGKSFERVEIGVFGTVEAVVDDGRGVFYLAWWHENESGFSGGVHRSTDFGTTWVPVAAPTPLAKGVVTLAVGPDGDILAGPRRHGGGGVFCSTDQGETWRPRCVR